MSYYAWPHTRDYYVLIFLKHAKNLKSKCPIVLIFLQFFGLPKDN